jgi:hypothetical protein
LAGREGKRRESAKVGVRLTNAYGNPLRKAARDQTRGWERSYDSSEFRSIIAWVICEDDGQCPRLTPA